MKRTRNTKHLTSVLFILLALCIVACSGTSQKSEAVLATETAIASIGTVSLDSRNALEEAEKLYAFLTDAEKEQVSNRLTLLEARNAYDALVAEEEQHAEQERAEYEQRISDVGTAFNQDYDVGKAISAYKGLYENANEEQKKEIESLIQILENACIPGTHFLSYEALAVAQYSTPNGFVFEKSGDAFIYRNNEKGIFRKSYYVRCEDYKKDPVLSFMKGSVTGEYECYLSSNTKDGSDEKVGIAPYWSYLDNCFSYEEAQPDWGVQFNGKYESKVRVYTDDLGNRLYTKSYTSSSGKDTMYFLLKRA